MSVNVYLPVQNQNKPVENTELNLLKCFFKDRKEETWIHQRPRAIKHDPNTPDVYKNQSSVELFDFPSASNKQHWTRESEHGLDLQLNHQRGKVKGQTASTQSSVTEYLWSVRRHRWGEVNSDRTDECAVRQARGPCSTLCDVMCYLHYLWWPAAHSTSTVNTLSQKHTRDEFLPNTRHFSTPADLMELNDRLSVTRHTNWKRRSWIRTMKEELFVFQQVEERQIFSTSWILLWIFDLSFQFPLRTSVSLTCETPSVFPAFRGLNSHCRMYVRDLHRAEQVKWN